MWIRVVPICRGEAGSRGNRLPGTRKLGANNPGPFLLIRIVFKKYPVLTPMLEAERISPEMPLWRVDPVKSFQISGLKQRLAIHSDADLPMLNRVTRKRVMDRLFQQHRGQPPRHVQICRPAIQLPFSLVWSG